MYRGAPDQHGECIVVDVAGLQLDHPARHPADTGSGAVDGAVDDGAVAALPA